MCLNRTSEWKVVTIWISRELSLFIFERLYMWYAWIRPQCEKLLLFEFLEGFRCLISSVSIYYKPESDLSVKSYDHLNFSRTSIVQFWASRYVIRPNWTAVWKVMIIWIFESFRGSIPSISIYDVLELDLRVKSYNYLNFSRGSVFQFPASRCIMSLNQTSV